MLDLKTGDEDADRELQKTATARLILQHVGLAFVQAPNEVMTFVEGMDCTFAIHGVINPDDGHYDVMLLEVVDETDAEVDAASMALFRLDDEADEAGVLLYSRCLYDNDETDPLSDEALLVRVAVEELMGIEGLDDVLSQADQEDS